MPHCDDALKAIGKAIRIYQERFDGSNPLKLEHLVEKNLLTPWDIICPASSDRIGECSYVYRGCDVNAGIAEEMIIAYCRESWHKGRRNILFVHNEVQRPPEKKFNNLIEKDNELRRQFGLPEK